MSIVSFSYLLFLIIVLCLYYVCIYFEKDTLRYLVLLFAGFFFYSFGNLFQLIYLLSVILITYLGGILLSSDKTYAFRRAIFITCIVLCIGLLSLIKFDRNIVMPLGISFYTFQSTGYLIDVYNKSINAEKDPIKYALFVSFFPQIAQGPIGRYDRLSPSLFGRHTFDYDLFTRGWTRIALGVFKKIFIANTLAKYVDIVFSTPGEYSGVNLLLGGFFYTIQLYADFSGYMDIALGSAACFGISLDENFDTPYFAVSVRDFWHRWHMTLSSWLRDYVYIPLGGSRKGKLRKNLNIMATMLISGIWHGNGWNFVIWGGMHGIYQVAENLLPAHKKDDEGSRIRKLIRGFITFILVMIAWMVFRVEHTTDIVLIAERIGCHFYIPGQLSSIMNENEIGISYFVYSVLGMMLVLFFDILRRLKGSPIDFLFSLKKPVRWGLTILMLFAVFLFFNNEAADSNNFLYYRF